jgi:hypothetical protein
MDALIACGRGALGHAVPARDRDSGRETPCRIRACRAAHSARSTRYEPLAFRAALARACNAAIVDVRRFDLIATSFPSLLRCIAGSTRWQRWESSFSRDARMFHGLRVTVLRQRGRPRRRKCEAHHMCLAAPALLLCAAGGGLSRITAMTTRRLMYWWFRFVLSGRFTDRFLCLPRAE